MTWQELRNAIPSSNDMEVYLEYVAASLGRTAIDPLGGLRRRLGAAIQ